MVNSRYEPAPRYRGLLPVLAFSFPLELQPSNGPKIRRALGPGNNKRRVRASQHFRSFWGAWRTIAGYEAIHMIRKGQAYGSAKVGLLHRSFSVCSLRRAKFPIIYPDLQLDYKVATHPLRRPSARDF
jgi:hypothetical protein